MERKILKKPVSKESYIMLIIFIGLFLLFSLEMGVANFLGSLLASSHYLLIEIAFFIMAVCVLTGAVAGIFSEFGVIALLNIVFGPIVKFLYRLPGVAGIAALSAYLSDNPAVISLYKEKEFKKQFKPWQIPVLCNLGTSFGMGIVIAITFMSYGESYFLSVGVGIIGAIFGSVVSVFLLTRFSRKHFKISKTESPFKKLETDELEREIRDGSPLNRLLESALDGGKNGVAIGLQVIPGILIISTLVLMLTWDVPVDGYTGEAQQGIALLPKLGDHLMFIFKPLFGFEHSEAIAFPLTSLGSAGAALGIVKDFITNGLVNAKDIAVFTAIGTTWSGYLSTHVSMMDALDSRPLTSKAILAHTIGGLASGIFANYLYMFISLFM